MSEEKVTQASPTAEEIDELLAKLLDAGILDNKALGNAQPISPVSAIDSYVEPSDAVVIGDAESPAVQGVSAIVSGVESLVVLSAIASDLSNRMGLTLDGQNRVVPAARSGASAAPAAPRAATAPQIAPPPQVTTVIEEPIATPPVLSTLKDEDVDEIDLASSVGAGWSELYRERIARDPDAYSQDDWDEDWDDGYYDDYDYYDDADEPRRALIWPLALTAVALFLVLTGGLTLFLRTLQVNAEAASVLRNESAQSSLNEALAFIQEADRLVVAIDKALYDPVTQESSQAMQSLIDSVGSTQQTLDSAISLAEYAKANFTDESDQAIAQYTIDAAQYRKQLIVLGIQVVGANIIAMESAIKLDDAWTSIVAAYSMMQEAADSTTTGGSEQISRSLELNREALICLDSALALLDEAAMAFPEAQIHILRDYVVAKRDSCTLAIASDEAMLADDYSTARQKNEEFLVKDAEAVELALQIPDDPLSIIVEAYDDRTAGWRNAYQECFTQAADIDALLREWLSRRDNLTYSF